MISQDQLRSGHDIEVLLGENYLSCLLLSSLDTGVFPVSMALAIPGTTIVLTVRAPQTIPRAYTPNPAATPFLTTPLPSFAVTILQDNAGDLRVTLVVDLLITLGFGAPLAFNSVTLFCDLTIGVVTAPAPSGGGTSTTLSLATLLVTSNHQTVGPLVANPANQALIVAQLNAILAAQALGGNLVGSEAQSVVLRKHTADPDQRALGLYVNLRMRTGFAPDEVAAPRGDENAAVNFLPAGQDFAFGLNPNVFQLLERHIRVETADELNGKNADYWLLHEKKRIGYLKDVTVKVVRARYDIGPNEQSEPTDALKIRLKINAVPVGSDIAVELWLFPVLDSDGIVNWQIKNDIDVDLLAEFAPLFLIFMVSVLNPIAGLAFGTILSTLLLAGNTIVARIVEDQFTSESIDDATSSLASLLPQRVDVSTRRWDPFYRTKHQVLVPFDFFELDDDGMVACGKAWLANQPDPIRHVVIRHDDRVDGQVARLRYRVRGFQPSAPDYTLNVAATDRGVWILETGDPEPDIVSLSLQDAIARRPEGRVRADIPYEARNVDVRRNQVRSILVLSSTEIDEANRPNAGKPATPRLDMAPRELGALQLQRLLFLRRYVLIERQGVPYYRDDADKRTSNNLMSQPKYRSPDIDSQKGP